MKSVTLVAFIGSWLRSSLTSRPRKSCELIVLEGRLEETLLEDVAEFVPETVMRNSGSLRRLRAALSADCSLEGRLQIKRMASRIQARIHAAESIENAAEFAARPACNEGVIGARERAIAPAKSPRSELRMFGFQGKKKSDATAPSSPQALGER
ncbi:MAG TPA: hypothetical protein VNS33_14740 [Bradyrhizobium sp.]|nr:hypothetical protein [Bradyrhizobium sp.]